MSDDKQALRKPISERDVLYFVDGKCKSLERKVLRGLEAHVASLVHAKQREKELAFLSTVSDLDEAVFDFEKEQTNSLDGSLIKLNEIESKRTRSFLTKENARDAAHRWHEVHRRLGHPSRAITDVVIRSGKLGYITDK